MSTNLFIGQKVKLSALDPEHDPAIVMRWSRDPEFLQMVSTGIARPWTAAAIKKDLDEHAAREEPKPGEFPFDIRTLEAEGQPSRLVGFVELSIPHWPHRDAWIGIGIGERTDWSQGYGSDAMRLILRYAFAELNLRRVSLTVFEYNERAVHTYRKLGFVEEGRHRQYLHRFGRRWDMLVMGMLREEWRAE
jgi:RimJ/RimL family protein N-acetyltransferase